MARSSFKYSPGWTDSASMAASITSVPIKVSHYDGFSVQATWKDGSTPIGVLTLQASNEVDVFAIGETQWVEIANTSQAVSGSSGTVLWDVVEPRYSHVRVYYSATSGSGTMRLSFCGSNENQIA
jgi:hypothetical protein